MSNALLLYRFMDERWGLEAIMFRRFRVSRLMDLNDPFEWRFGIEGHDPQKEAEALKWAEDYAEKVHKFTGVLSYSGTASQPVLWSHYANKHRGLALEVKHPKGCDSPPLPMEYTDDRPKLDANRTIISTIAGRNTSRDASLSSRHANPQGGVTRRSFGHLTCSHRSSRQGVTTSGVSQEDF